MSFLKHLLGNRMGGHHGNSHQGRDHHGGYYPSSTPASTITCPQCRTVQTNNARFCDNCGTSLLGKTCTCGSAIAPGAKFCSQCGKSQ